MNHTVYVMPFALRFVDTDELTVSEARVRRAATDDVMWLVRRRTVAGGAEYTLNTRAGAGDGSYIELDTAVHANAGLSYTAPNPLPLSDLPEEFTVHSVHVVMHRNIAPFYRVISIEFVALFEVDRHDSRHEGAHVVYGHDGATGERAYVPIVRDVPVTYAQLRGRMRVRLECVEAGDVDEVALPANYDGRALEFYVNDERVFPHPAHVLSHRATVRVIAHQRTVSMHDPDTDTVIVLVFSHAIRSRTSDTTYIAYRIRSGDVFGARTNASKLIETLRVTGGNVVVAQTDGGTTSVVTAATVDVAPPVRYRLRELALYREYALRL